MSEPMTAEREARIRDKFIKSKGQNGVKCLAELCFMLMRVALDSGGERIISAMLGELRVVCDLLADVYDIDTTPFEVSFLETMEEEIDGKQEEHDDD